LKNGIIICIHFARRKGRLLSVQTARSGLVIQRAAGADRVKCTLSNDRARDSGWVKGWLRGQVTMVDASALSFGWSNRCNTISKNLRPFPGHWCKESFKHCVAIPRIQSNALGNFTPGDSHKPPSRPCAERGALQPPCKRGAGWGE
jgi:hypothetical protein